MRLSHIHLELQPMTRLPVIESALAPANDGVRAGLQVEICFRAHRLHDVDDGRKTRGRARPFCEN